MTTTETRIIALIKAAFGVDIACLDQPLDQKFIADLKADSLDMVEICMSTEEEFGIEITDDEAEPFVSDDGDGAKSVRDWCALVAGKLAESVA